MHKFNAEVQEVADEILAYALERLRLEPPLDGPLTAQELYEKVGNTITAKGLGGLPTLEIFKEVLAKACISTDHERYLAFIPTAPSEYSSLFDLVVSAASIYGGSWQEGAGAVFAENQALRWLADLAGFPAAAGGVFVSGGTIGNLSALVVAREDARRNHPEHKGKWAVVCGDQAHSSIAGAAKVMDVDVVKAVRSADGKIYGDAVEKAIEDYEKSGGKVFCIVATAGTTNLGIIDHLDSIDDVAVARDIWFHIDGAYGLAALCAPSVRAKFDGIEHADSFIVDPHKWLFAPFDACALIYKDPTIAKDALAQHASYLDTLHEGDEWNPSDYAIHLTRRTRGLPFWFSLAANGTDAYRDAMEYTMLIAKKAVELIKVHPNLELLMEPELSIVAFTRKGWNKEDYQRWSDKLLKDQIGFVTPSSHEGKPILRFAIVNPWTNVDDLEKILETL
ncbi:MAG: pyridoxal phosphate-dependent decarboxylase family protein [Candidatus Nanopelagicaceae bacterium]